jgi:hypothetical protein
MRRGRTDGGPHRKPEGRNKKLRRAGWSGRTHDFDPLQSLAISSPPEPVTTPEGSRLSTLPLP